MTSAITKAYAEALFTTLKEKNFDLDKALSCLKDIKEIIMEDKINKFLIHPNIDKNEKIDILKEAFKNIDQTISSFIFVLVENDRILDYEGIIESFEEELNELKGIINVEIITKEKLSREKYKEIINYLEKNYQKKVIAHETLRDDIIGGIIIKVNGTIIDNSLLNKLKAIKDAVLENR